MKRLLIGAALTASALCGAAAAAQVAPPPGVADGTVPIAIARPHVPPVIRSPVLMPMAAGAVVTRDDVVRHVRALFARLDTNHDGYVTRAEAAALRRRMMAPMHAAIGERAGERTARAGTHGMAMADPGAMFERMDTNHDGVISRQEFMAAHARMHQRAMSAMGDMGMMGSRSRMGPMENHMGALGEGQGMRLPADWFDRADANHDGRVSLQEAEAAALAHFDRMDLNHDGRLTPDERRQAHATMLETRPH